MSGDSESNPTATSTRSRSFPSPPTSLNESEANLVDVVRRLPAHLSHQRNERRIHRIGNIIGKGATSQPNRTKTQKTHSDLLHCSRCLQYSDLSASECVPTLPSSTYAMRKKTSTHALFAIDDVTCSGFGHCHELSPLLLR